jgi:neutral ceramidase
MLQAGTSILDITPPLGTLMPGLFHERRAELINDPLHVRSFALESDGVGIAVAVCDLISVKRPYLDAAKQKIADTIGLSPSHVLICCTHTHTGAQTGDDAYTASLINRIADGVRLAWASRKPAQVGHGSGREERVVFNRRYRLKDGTVRTNPGVGNPEVVEAVGPIDPEVGVLCLRQPNGDTIGMLANYALHYIGGGDHQRAVSADYFGIFSEMIQRLRGERFVAALSNGACADINNVDVLGGARPKNEAYQHAERVAAVVAAAALWAWNEMEFTDDVPLGAAMEAVRLKRRELHSEEALAQAREIEAKGAQTMAERAFIRRIQRIENLPEVVETWVQVLRIGDLALVGMPGEYFVELGLDLKRRSSFGQTLILELANDSIGYLPTRRAFEEGGYEAESSHFLPGVGEQLADTAMKLLAHL